MKLALEIAGGVATFATIGTIMHLAARRKHFEDGVDRFTDQVAIVESEQLDHHEAILRRLAAASLVMPEGATPAELKRKAQAKPKHASGDALVQLVRKRILDVVDHKDGSRIITPNSTFIDAVITRPDEAQRIQEQIKEYKPDFTLEELLPYASDPEVAPCRRTC